MKLAPLAFAAALAAVFTAVPFEAAAQGVEDERPDGREGGRPRRGPEDPAAREKGEALRALEVKVNELAHKTREGTDAEKNAAKAELRKQLGELYDAKVAFDSSMIEKLEQHLAELKARVAKKKAARTKAIESRFERMTGGADDW